MEGRLATKGLFIQASWTALLMSRLATAAPRASSRWQVPSSMPAMTTAAMTTATMTPVGLRLFSTSRPSRSPDEQDLPPRPPPPSPTSPPESQPAAAPKPLRPSFSFGSKTSTAKPAGSPSWAVFGGNTTTPNWARPRQSTPSAAGDIFSRFNMPAGGFKVDLPQIIDGAHQNKQRADAIMQGIWNPDGASQGPTPRDRPWRLVPQLGRTVIVTPQMDVARAFAMCQLLCRRNCVASSFRDQRFHERPGLKRKRLESTRRKDRFREGIMATIRRVSQLRRQGW